MACTARIAFIEQIIMRREWMERTFTDSLPPTFLAFHYFNSGNSRLENVMDRLRGAEGGEDTDVYITSWLGKMYECDNCLGLPLASSSCGPPRDDSHSVDCHSSSTYRRQWSVVSELRQR